MAASWFVIGIGDLYEESKGLQQVRWNIFLVFVSEHLLLQLRRTSVFLGSNLESRDDSLK
jgi:hypothetical protein